MWFDANEPKWVGATQQTKLVKTCIKGIQPVEELKTVYLNTAQKHDVCVFVYDRTKLPIETMGFSSNELKLKDGCIVWGFHGSVGKVATASGFVTGIDSKEVQGAVTTDWGVSGGPWLDRDNKVVGVHYGVHAPNEINKATRIVKFSYDKLTPEFFKTLKSAKWICTGKVDLFPNGTGPLNRGA